MAEAAAFEAMFRAQYVGVRDFAARYVRDDAVADDIAQDVFAAAWQRWPGELEALPTAECKLYLYKATRNRALNYLAHVRIEQRHVQTVLDDPTPVAEWETDTSSVDALRAIVERTIERLPERCRLVYTLSRRDHLSYAEIADVLGISINTVKTQMGRALEALRSAVSPLLVTLVAVGVSRTAG